jgi:hypothetical protein
VVLVVREFDKGVISPRELGIVLAVLAITIGSTTVIVLKRSVARFTTSSRSPAEPHVEAETREFLLRQIRRAKIRVITMTVVLLLGLTLPEIKSAPGWVLAVALAINLLITTTSLQTMIRLRKMLSQAEPPSL